MFFIAESNVKKFTVQPAAQGVDANAKVSGDLLGLPSPCSATIRTAPALKASSWRRGGISFFFIFRSIVLPLSILQLTFLSVGPDMRAAAANGTNMIVVEKAGALTGESIRNSCLLMASGAKYINLTTDEMFDYIYDYISQGIPSSSCRWGGTAF